VEQEEASDEKLPPPPSSASLPVRVAAASESKPFAADVGEQATNVQAAARMEADETATNNVLMTAPCGCTACAATDPARSAHFEPLSDLRGMNHLFACDRSVRRNGDCLTSRRR
jgi:hypothetical protein